MKAILLTLSVLFFLVGKAQETDVQHYRFELELSDGSDAVSGRAQITVRFLEDASRFSLDLVSLKDEKGMVAYLVSEKGERQMTEHKDDRLLINLARPARKDEVRTFEVQYMGVPGDGLIISRNKYGDRTFFADNWPNRAHHWLPCKDTPSDKASVEFIVTAPDHYRIISNGQLLEETALDKKRRRTHWKEEVPLPTKIMVIGAARFAVTRVDSAYSVPVTSWVYPQDSARGAYDYALADDVLQFFSSYVGPYAYGKLANVQSKTIFGGMENASAIFYAENSVTGDRKSEGLIAHEIAHQWFGNMATEKSFAHVWLSEGFATYLTHLYLERKYGRDTLLNGMREDRNTVISFTRANNRPVVDSASELMDLLSPNSYQKGGWVLHMLRREVGDTVFQRILQTYYARYAGKNAESRDFASIATEVSGKNLQPFFEQWLHRPGIPVLQFRAKKEKDALVLTVQQGGRSVFSFPLQLALETGSGTPELHRVPIDQKEQVIRLPHSNAAQVRRILIDPNVSLLYSGDTVVRL